MGIVCREQMHTTLHLHTRSAGVVTSNVISAADGSKPHRAMTESQRSMTRTRRPGWDSRFLTLRSLRIGTLASTRACPAGTVKMRSNYRAADASTDDDRDPRSTIGLLLLRETGSGGRRYMSSRATGTRSACGWRLSTIRIFTFVNDWRKGESLVSVHHCAGSAQQQRAVEQAFTSDIRRQHPFL
ncbi:uncharacterized protein Z520_11315 [Fonsecaea multimorphosa CBS 102226]|uniref:Uncharacterized protein n=1 Tax=Fonsecaea multimorphosa CBS 102226 TaxID=1442371 RepID=A0A0D2JIN9_9EURO|nr:uncharacterized protein Z520_11315 [Fonsecaea multimorphosa CBS 102226]KIX93042.1 hypothetical protein Z520_11315 [Fonsecaea multimorphosa CBS 102226]OAL18289.1 hypothetical protein AYO22_10867 [Fonsecaea multimorphosa]